MMERAQAVILENCTVTTAEIAAGLDLNVTGPRREPLAQQSSLRHTHSAHNDN